MKIIHLCLSNFYIDGYSYQENELVRQHVNDGHDVVVIASTETFDQDRKLAYLAPGTYAGADGARVVRVPYRRWLPHAVMKKLRLHPGVYDLIAREMPDVMLFHSLCGWELLTAAKYKRAFRHVRLFADSHEDFNTSARTFLSRNILHALYYRTIARAALKDIEKVLCISVETIDFVRDFYGIPSERLEFYPLGGMIFSDSEYVDMRARARSAYGIGANDVLFVQSGKIDSLKRPLESVRAFSKTAGRNHHFYLVGHLYEDVRKQVIEAIQADSRIKFLGWKSAEDLRALLCAADVYVQPGSQSATMQMSLCARCAVIIADVPSHRPYMRQNGWLVTDARSIDAAFSEAVSSGGDLSGKSTRSAEVAEDLLDYRKLAARLYAAGTE